MPKWGKGQSGNPRGRKPGSGQVAKLRASLAEHVPEIIASLVAAAKAGDTPAAKLILDRVVPAVKSEELPVRFPLPPRGLAEQGGAVLAGMAKGSLAPVQAAVMLAALASQARLVELEDLARRIGALEEAVQRTPRRVSRLRGRIMQTEGADHEVGKPPADRRRGRASVAYR